MLAGALALTFVAAQNCQQSQVRLTKEQAIGAAEREVAFEPTHMQVRLLRQGLGSTPFWVVSLSIPRDDDLQTFRRLAVVRVNANTGKVEDVRPETQRR